VNEMNETMKISTGHLTEYELESVLIGDAAPASAAHLAACGSCRTALSEMEAPLAGFRAVTLAWSERRSATMPLRDLEAAQRRAASGWRQRFALSTSLVVALAVGVAIPVLRHSAPTEPGRNPVAPSDVAIGATPASPDEQISRDNLMLKAIDQELDSRAESPVSLGLQPATRSRQSYASPMQD
jgi:hypothetical protein